MKLSNIFKKDKKTSVKTQKIDKKQLSKVIGGADSTGSGTDRKSGSIILHDYNG